jgi:hypothetical protein
MKTKLCHPGAVFNRRFLISLSVFVTGTILAAFASTGSSNSASRTPKSKSAMDRRPQCRGFRPVVDLFGANEIGRRPTMAIAVARNSIGHMSVGMQGAGVFRSTDNGQD